MFSNYIPKNSVIHELNPLVKLAWALTVIILSFTFWDLNKLVFLSIISFGLGLLTKLGKHIIKTVLFVVLPLLFMLLLFHAVLNPAMKEEWFTFWIFTVKMDGIILALKYFFRLLGFILVSYVLIFTTHPADLITALLKIGVPKQVGYVVLATIQFIPLMIDDAKKIIDAQQARGLETKGNVVKRIQSFIPMIMPLILSLVDTAYDRTISLELRAFFSKIKRTNYRVFKWLRRDTYWLVSVVLVIIAGLIVV